MSFDYLRWKGEMYQTTDTPSQFEDLFEISDDGYLWWQQCDHKLSTPGQVTSTSFTKDNFRWTCLKNWSGTIRFFSGAADYIAVIKEGQVQQLVDISIEAKNG